MPFIAHGFVVLKNSPVYCFLGKDCGPYAFRHVLILVFVTGFLTSSFMQNFLQKNIYIILNKFANLRNSMILSSDGQTVIKRFKYILLSKCV